MPAFLGFPVALMWPSPGPQRPESFGAATRWGMAAASDYAEVKAGT